MRDVKTPIISTPNIGKARRMTFLGLILFSFTKAIYLYYESTGQGNYNLITSHGKGKITAWIFNMAKNTKNLKFTVGITTNYGKEQILETVKSIRASVGVSKFRFVIVADHTPISKSIKSKLREYSVELIENSYDSSAWEKAKQILSITKTKILIITQDDLLFPEDTLKKVISAFEKDEELTYLCVKNEPLKSKNHFERAVSVGTNITNNVAKRWKSGDNYLAAFGRIMAFRTNWINKVPNIKSDPISVDAYMYFENKRKSGKFICLWDAPVLFRNPQNMADHLKKSSRFQYSEEEMDKYKIFNNLSSEYKVPRYLYLLALVEEFAADPIHFIYYLYIYAYTRIFKTTSKKVVTPVWDVEESTKVLV